MAIAKLSIDLEARFAKLDQDLRSIDGRIATFGGNLKNAFVGVAAAVGGTQIVAAFKGVVDSLDKVEESAGRLDTSTEYLSALGYAAKMNGIEFDELNKALTKFTGLLADGQAGNKEAVETLTRLGVSAKNFGNVEAAFAQFADTIGKTDQPVQRAGLLIDALGEKIGVKFGPMLANGSAGLADLRAEAEKLGGVIDGKVARQAAEFNDNLDRLGTLAGAAAKSIAGSLLPGLNQIAESFIISRKNAESLWEALSRPLPGTAFVDVQDNLAKVRREYEQLDYRISNGRAKEGDEARFAKLERELAYWEQISAAQNKADSKPAVRNLTADNKPVKSGKTAKEKTVGFTDYDAILIERINKAIESTDIVKADELAAALAKLDQLAAAGLDPAIVSAVRDDLTGATKMAADELDRLNKLLGETQSSKINETQKDMLLLAKTLENGRISEEQYLEAVNARLNEGAEKLERNRSLAEEFGLTFSSALEDAVATGKGVSGVLKGIEQDILRIIARLAITEPLMKAASGINWGGLIGNFVTAWLGGSSSSSSWSSSTPGYSSGDLGSGIRLNALGNIYDSPALSAYAGSVVSSPTLFPFAKGIGLMGEAGAEGIFPLKRGKDGKLGVSAEGVGGVTINVINNTDATAKTERRSDGKGGSIIDIVIERARGAIATDIMRGNGPVPAAMESVYGLSRAAGVY